MELRTVVKRAEERGSGHRDDVINPLMTSSYDIQKLVYVAPSESCSRFLSGTYSIVG